VKPKIRMLKIIYILCLSRSFRILNIEVYDFFNNRYFQMSRFNIFRGKASDFTFEELKEDELELCIDTIHKGVGKENSNIPNRKYLKETLKGPNLLTLVGKSGGKIKGVINGITPQIFDSSLLPRIMFVYVVDEKSARQGLPGMLINEFVNVVKKRLKKASCVEVILTSKNLSSIVLYSLNGFIISGFIKGDNGAEDQILMRKFTRKEPRKSFTV